MTARIIDGKQIAARLREQLKGEVGALEMQLGRPARFGSHPRR